MSNNLPPLSWSVTRRLIRLCHEYDKSPHLKSLLRSPLSPYFDPNNYTPLEKTIIKYVYPMPNQIFYRPIQRPFVDILKKVSRMPASDDQMEQERLDAAFTFIKILQQNVGNRMDDETEKEERGFVYERLFDVNEEQIASIEEKPEQEDGSTHSLDTYKIQLLNNDELSSGVFLVSHPLTRDGTFYKTVIYISDYAKRYGAIGYTINKSLQFGRGAGGRNGGPVVSGKHRIVKLKDGKIALQRSNTQYSRARLKLMKRPDEEKIANDSIEKEISFQNSTEWSSGQLEQEIESGAWFVVSASHDLMFDKCDSGEKLWDDIMKALGGEYEDFVNIRKTQLSKKKPRKVWALTL